MSLQRYLLNIAYIGTHFRGAQRQVIGTFPRADDPSTIQGRLEMGLKHLRPNNDPCVSMSSRTDAGVHAINSACHVDLIRQNGYPYDPNIVTFVMNKHFNRDEVPIRVLKTYIVPETFHCRGRALYRTYLYRIIVAKSKNIDYPLSMYSQFIPIEEMDRALFLCTNSFDLDKMKEAAKMLEGYHDFRTFMGIHAGSNEKITRKTLDFVKIETTNQGGFSPFSWPIHGVDENVDYLFLNVYIRSQGFLYKQVSK